MSRPICECCGFYHDRHDLLWERQRGVGPVRGRICRACKRLVTAYEQRGPGGNTRHPETLRTVQDYLARTTPAAYRRRVQRFARRQSRQLRYMAAHAESSWRLAAMIVED